MARVQVAPWSKENSQLMSLATSHLPLRVMPSVTLKPVSLNDKTGGLSTTPKFTDPGEGVAIGNVENDPAELDPPPPQALKNTTAPSSRAKRRNEKNLYNIHATSFVKEDLSLNEGI
jgi:hypothetical protein